MTDSDLTRQLLLRWHGGDKGALVDLLERHLPWIEQRVRDRLSSRLHSKEETADLVQEACIEVLRYAPPFVVSSGAAFRALLARIVENALRGRHDWFSARRREFGRERPLERDTVIELDPPVEQVEPADRRVAADEMAARVRLALEFLGEEDRFAVVRRDWEGADFAAIGRDLGVAADAARMRYHRALVRLAELVDRLLAVGAERFIAEQEAERDG